MSPDLATNEYLPLGRKGLSEIGTEPSLGEFAVMITGSERLTDETYASGLTGGFATRSRR